MKRIPGKPNLILFQQMTEATARKARNDSADATTGGGARDLRLRPYDKLNPFMERLLPQTRHETRPGGEPVAVRWGTVTWGDGLEEREIKYWPPTYARPGEGRITRISSLPPLVNPPLNIQGAVILFVRDERGLLWVRYATSHGLRNSIPQVGNLIRSCIDNAAPSRIATGYIDLTPNGLGSWCNSVEPEDDT